MVSDIPTTTGATGRIASAPAGARFLRDLGASEGTAADAPRMNGSMGNSLGNSMRDSTGGSIRTPRLTVAMLADAGTMRSDMASARIAGWEGMASDDERARVLDRIGATIAEGHPPAPDDVSALRATGRAGIHRVVAMLVERGASRATLPGTVSQRLSVNAPVYAQAGRDDLAALSETLGAAAR